MSFVHLHNHTHYSLLDGLSKPKECVQAAKKHGSPAIAITDHGVLYGAVEFYKEAKKEDIKPIIGCEIYVAPQGRLRKEPGTPINHLTLLAYSNEGYQNLIQLVTKAHLEGFYYKPRVDHGLLREFHKGLIALSGCVASEVSEATLNDDLDKAFELIKMYQNIFGRENFFMEIMDHPEMKDQVKIRQKALDLAKTSGATLVATNDNHYLLKEHSGSHDILICIQTNRTIQDQNRMRYIGNYSVRTPEEMEAAFSDCPDSLENTLRIAERCNVEIQFGRNLIPVFDTPDRKSYKEYLRELCIKGLYERYGDNPPPEIKERLEYELAVIHKSGFEVYFLIVYDLVFYAKEKGIVVGPGRGSAAGSLVSYCLKITDIDPLQYGLLFERFLNPERVSMPDIDIDFDDERREEVLNYVVQKYGRDRVAQIITFGTMAARAAVRDVGRAMGYPYAEVDRIAKLVPPPVQGRHIPLKESIKNDPELKKVYETEPRANALLSNAVALEGTIRQAGTHACAVVFSKEPLTNYTPLQIAPGGETEIITQFSMKPLEDLGLLKMDFLGLRNLTIIKHAVENIEKSRGTCIDIHSAPLDDKKTFDLLTAGETTGVFQLESSGMRHYLKELKPTGINDIIAMVSLYRPGPMPWIPLYIKGKHESEKIKYLHASFESILKETYGVAVYQEQILQLARDFSGFTLGEADILRKAVGKKSPQLLEEQKEKFIEGAVNRGHSRKFAESVFEKVIEPFAAYGFNKSHATCYAFIAYQTAYLKAHFPVEFMAALMTADSDNIDRIVIEVNECETMKIKVLPPSVNESFGSFTAVDDNTIRFGLSAIKGLGDNAVSAIIQVRESGRFRDLEDFAKRVKSEVLNKKSLESLAYSGALDEFGDRKAIAASTEEIVKYARQVQKRSEEGQTDIFGMLQGDSFEAPAPLQVRNIAPSTLFERLGFEKEFLGLYVSGHPLHGLQRYLAKKVHSIASLNEDDLGKKLKIGGLVTKFKRILTKTGAYMAYAGIEDLSGRMEVVIFPKTYQQFSSSLGEGQILFFEGRLSKRHDDTQFIADSVQSVSLDSLIASAKREGLYGEPPLNPHKKDTNAVFVIDIPESAPDKIFADLKNLLNENRGHTKVILNVGRSRIKVPFGIEVDEELKGRIEMLLKN